MAKKDVEFEAKRKECIVELNTLDKKYGSAVFRSACNRKLTIDRQLVNTRKMIMKKEKELEMLKSGKPLPSY